MNVTSARIYVLARSREASPNYTDTKTYTLGSAGDVGPFNDNFKRHVFTTTVRLTNIAGRQDDAMKRLQRRSRPVPRWSSA